MSIKLTGNGLWESSRMMLPEHKIRIQAEHRKIREVELAKKRYIPDEQEIEDNIRKLEEAMENGSMVDVTMYQLDGNVQVRGLILQIDPNGGRLKLGHGFQKTWVPFSEVLRVEVEEAY